jgi:hypothetical protein
MTPRAWCEEIASTLRVQDIRPHGAPYLRRYYLAGWNPFAKQGHGAAFLHHFVSSDPSEEVHSHPWGWALSVILVGGYREIRCVGTVRTVREYHPGEVNLLGPDDRHRIDLLEADCWTLFLVGDYAQPWGFHPIC